MGSSLVGLKRSLEIAIPRSNLRDSRAYTNVPPKRASRRTGGLLNIQKIPRHNENDRPHPSEQLRYFNKGLCLEISDQQKKLFRTRCRRTWTGYPSNTLRDQRKYRPFPQVGSSFVGSLRRRKPKCSRRRIRSFDGLNQ